MLTIVLQAVVAHPAAGETALVALPVVAELGGVVIAVGGEDGQDHGRRELGGDGVALHRVGDPAQGVARVVVHGRGFPCALGEVAVELALEAEGAGPGARAGALRRGGGDERGKEWEEEGEGEVFRDLHFGMVER